MQNNYLHLEADSMQYTSQRVQKDHIVDSCSLVGNKWVAMMHLASSAKSKTSEYENIEGKSLQR